MKRKFKNITTSMMVTLIIMFIAYNSQAQPGGQQGPPPLPTDDQIEEMVEDLDKKLSLSDEQEEQVSDKYFAHFAAIEKMMIAGRPSREVMETMETDFEEDVKSLLTDDQQDLYSSYIADQKQKRPQRQRK